MPASPRRSPRWERANTRGSTAGAKPGPSSTTSITPSGRSIQSLGVMPDIVVNQPVVEAPAEGEEAATSEARQPTSEADLRGSISNDSMTEDERKLLEEERARIEETAKLRDEDYQLAYAVDILRGLNAVAAPMADGQ